jgi:hypothetical protein
VDEAGLQAWIELLAGRRQRNRSHAPFEQLEAEILLECADLVAERAGRNEELLCRLGQAQMARSGLERAQSIERRERLVHEVFSIVR